MSRSIFFSFHYDDIWRVSQVRNSWITKDSVKESFRDKAAWEKLKRKGDKAIHAWIDRQLKGTSVTVVLIGTETASREYVKYEIKRSIEKGNGLLGIYIDNIKNSDKKTCERGKNPLDDFRVKYTGFFTCFFDTTEASDRYKSYDWTNDNGFSNFNLWIEEAFEESKR